MEREWVRGAGGSGFEEGGQFLALVSVTALDRSKQTEVVTKIKATLGKLGKGLSADAKLELTNGELSKQVSTEISIYRAGGTGSPAEGGWDLDSIQAVAAAFPDTVAKNPVTLTLVTFSQKTEYTLPEFC